MRALAIAALFLVSASIQPAEAVTITFNPADVLLIHQGVDCTGNVPANTTSAATCGTLSFSYTLAGFNSGTDTITTGLLSLFFYDDNLGSVGSNEDSDAIHESVNITLDGTAFGGNPVVITTGSTAGAPFSPPAFNVVAALQDNGQLLVLLSQTGGANSDFYFAQSELTAEWRTGGGTNGETTVPEPGSLLLVGAGALGLARRFRSRRARS